MTPMPIPGRVTRRLGAVQPGGGGPSGLQTDAPPAVARADRTPVRQDFLLPPPLPAWVPRCEGPRFW